MLKASLAPLAPCTKHVTVATTSWAVSECSFSKAFESLLEDTCFVHLMNNLVALKRKGGVNHGKDQILYKTINRVTTDNAAQ
eukprot:m.57781 g.57781  ORF g.57781 m.57781 type:complete len:82 (+) comp11629_c0_seq3:317-562(+)